MFNKIIIVKKHNIRLKNIQLKNIRLKKIQLKTLGSITALFFLMTASYLHACGPKGHFQFNNKTDMPVRVVLTRLGGTYSCSKADPRIKCRGTDSKTINIKSHAYSPTICWVENKHKLLSLKTYFKDGDTFKDGSEISITKYGRSRNKKNIRGIMSHAGNQKYIKSSGCSKYPTALTYTCTVNLQMAGKK